MLLTILLTIAMMVLLFLMIWLAAVTLPFKSFAKNFPNDVQEKLKPRIDSLTMSGKTIAGRIILAVILLLMMAVWAIGAVDGINNGFTFLQFFTRFLTMGVGVKAFDIIGLDYFLLTKTKFFQHYFPETDCCKGWKEFGYNRNQQIKHCVAVPVTCLITAFILSMI